MAGYTDDDNNSFDSRCVCVGADNVQEATSAEAAAADWCAGEQTTPGDGVYTWSYAD